MDMSGSKPELHVAQQSRRDRLRIPQNNLEDFSNTIWEEQSLVHHNHHSGINPSSIFPSGFISFATNSNALSSQTDAMLYQDYGSNVGERRVLADDNSAFLNMPHQIPSSIVIAPQGCGNWKNVDSSSQLDCDHWTVNYASDLQAGRVTNCNDQKVVPFSEVLSDNNVNVNVNVRNISAHVGSRPNYDPGQDVSRSSLTNPSSSEISSQEDSQKHNSDACFMPVNMMYQNGLQNLVTVACSGTHSSIGESNHELVLLPSYANQPSAWLNRPVEINVNQWDGDQESMKFTSDATKQALSLSLSSNPSPKVCVPPSGIMKPFIISKSTSGKSLQDVVGASSGANNQRHVGPLGPFTGYATILKSSRFLKPAQELLEEFYSACRGKCEASDGIWGEGSSGLASVDMTNAPEGDAAAKGNENVGALSMVFQGSNVMSEDAAAAGSSLRESYKPEKGEKKAKLLFLQEEICRRYKLYHQQMQMVVSSFESVAGLSTATPYISFAVKRVARNFRCLKNAITDQLKHVTKSLGEDFLSGASSSKSDCGGNNVSKLKYMDQNDNNYFQKQKPFGTNVGFLEPQQHVWRPQRGLPERAVAILRAWLFDHFLHPYPTDTDKQMLATQTGLSRNQVSNWFINARVRVWKPMVEEIHMLETKGLAVEANNQIPIRSTNAKHSYLGTSTSCQRNNNLDQLETNKQMECSGSINNELKAEAYWNQEKRSRVDQFQGHHTSDMDVSSLLGFGTYNQRSGLEMGLGNVSLTLGLRHGVENVQPQLQRAGEDRLRQQRCGNQMVHDSVG